MTSLLHHILSIPLLVDEIAFPLDIPHLASAVLVCKEWQGVFETMLWRVAFVDNHYSSLILHNDTYLATARKHRDFIREVQTDSPRLFQELWSSADPSSAPDRSSLLEFPRLKTEDVQIARELIAVFALVENHLTVLEWHHDYEHLFEMCSVDAIILILKASPHLICFETNNFPFLKSGQAAKMMLAIPHRTQHLRLGTTQGTARSDTIALALQLCSTAVLSLEIEWTALAPSLPVDMSFLSQFPPGSVLSLRKVVLSNCNHLDLDAILVPLMHRAPLLRTLSFSRWAPYGSMDLTLESLRSRTCAHLDRLSFHYWQSCPKLITITEAFPAHTLRQLVIHDDFSRSEELVPLLVDRQAQSLERIEVRQVRRLYCQSMDLAPLFHSCPRLEFVRYLLYDGRSARDEYHGIDCRALLARPWVCTQLRELQALITNVPRADLFNEWKKWLIRQRQISEDWALAGITVDEEESQLLQRQFFKELGKCHLLSTLNLGRDGYKTLKRRCATVQFKALEFSLQCGLDELAALTRLRKLGISRLFHSIGMAEVQWISKHWPSLGSVTGLKRLEINTVTLSQPWTVILPRPRSDADVDEENADLSPQQPLEDPVSWLKKSRPALTLEED